jgi:Helix-turn-helix domain
MRYEGSANTYVGIGECHGGNSPQNSHRHRQLGIGRNTAYEAARLGQIPVIRVGKRLVVPVAALERLLQGETQNTAADHTNTTA